MREKISAWVEENREEIGLADSQFELVELTEGESNHVYKIKPLETAAKASEAVVRTSLKISEDRITRESKVLDMLESEKIGNIPQKIFFEDSDTVGQPVLAQTFVGDKDLGVKDMNGNQLENFAKALAEIHSLTPERYNQRFGKNEPESVSMDEELEGNFEKYSKEPYNIYREKAEIVDSRVERLFERHKQLYNEMIELDGEMPWRMTHGDPSNNIRSSGNQIFLIDWELARPGVPRFELTYMFRHNDIEQNEREEFLKIYRKYRETSELADSQASKWEKFLAFNDMIWAAKRKEKARENSMDFSGYEKMFERRINEVEEMYQ